MSMEERKITIERRATSMPTPTEVGSAPIDHVTIAADTPPVQPVLQQHENPKSDVSAPGASANSVTPQEGQSRSEAASPITQAAEQRIGKQQKLTLQMRVDRKRIELEQKEKQFERLQARLKAETRKMDDRRKIVAGAALLGLVKSGDAQAREMFDRIRQTISVRDRQLFEDCDGSIETP